MRHPQLERVILGSSRVITWTTARGDTLRGTLLLPAGYQPGQKYPLIVKVYADSARLGAIDHSYGGYSTLALIVQTRRVISWFDEHLKTDVANTVTGRGGTER